MATHQSRFNASQSLRYGAYSLIVSVALGGCATGGPAGLTGNASAQPTSLPINLISSQEEQLLREATERAQRLHTQLRELDARHVTIVRRLPATTDPKIALYDQKLATNRKAKVRTTAVQNNLTTAPERALTVTEKLEPQTKFALEFASGSSSLDEPNRLALMKNLGIPQPAVQKIGGNTKTRIVIELATYEKSGLDQLNRQRLKAITDVLQDAGIQAEIVKLKTKRIGPRSEDTAKGSASRIVRITKLEASVVRS
jgi:hypothetical protein